MSKFKIGDRVRFVNLIDEYEERNPHYFEEFGRVGTVKYVESDADTPHGPILRVVFDATETHDETDEQGWFSSRFELVDLAEFDPVAKPSHYNLHPKGIEAIDVIEDNPFYNLGAAMKYLWRVSWGSKGNDLEDLNKAKQYIEFEINRRERKAV